MLLDILYYALRHDELEAWYGDLPSPANRDHMPNKHKFEKENNYGSAPATTEVKTILKIADLLEAYLFIHEEALLGNLGLTEISDDIRQKLRFLVMDFFPHKNQQLEPEERYHRLFADFLKAYDSKVHPVMEMK